jgi:hypothetical protein
LKEKGVDHDLVLGNPLKRQKLDHEKTDLGKERDLRGICSNVKVSNDIYDATIEAAKHCPKLYQLLLVGTLGSDFEHRLIKPISTVVYDDGVMRFWSYDDFALDYMLAQQFNYEYLILCEAK